MMEVDMNINREAATPGSIGAYNEKYHNTDQVYKVNLKWVFKGGGGLGGVGGIPSSSH